MNVDTDAIADDTSGNRSAITYTCFDSKRLNAVNYQSSMKIHFVGS